MTEVLWAAGRGCWGTRSCCGLMFCTRGCEYLYFCNWNPKSSTILLAFNCVCVCVRGSIALMKALTHTLYVLWFKHYPVYVACYLKCVPLVWMSKYIKEVSPGCSYCNEYISVRQFIYLKHVLMQQADLNPRFWAFFRCWEALETQECCF